MRIAVIGPAKSGKSTACYICIQKWGGVKASFAAPVKRQVFEFLKDSREYGTMALVDKYSEAYCRNDRPNIGYMSLPPLHCNDPIAWIDAHKDEVRSLLQWWGTDYRRKQNDKYWINLMKPIIEKNENVYIDDCRFLNEADFLYENGFTFIGIRRTLPSDGTVDYNHSSEKEIYEIWKKYNVPIIENEVTVEELEKYIEQAVAV